MAIRLLWWKKVQDKWY